MLQRLEGRLIGRLIWKGGVCIAGVMICVQGTIISNAVAAAVMQAESKTMWDGVFSDTQRRTGAQVAKAACSSCHGDALAGDAAPPLAGPEFLSAWNGRSVGDLYEKIQTTMP